MTEKFFKWSVSHHFALWIRLGVGCCDRDHLDSCNSNPSSGLPESRSGC